MRKIQDEFTNLPISVQVRWQLRRKKARICLVCGGHATTLTYCPQHQPKPTAEAFWRKVDKTNLDGCWMWKSTVQKDGYGSIMAAGKLYRAHRIAWWLAYGEIPAGLQVLHRCDVPLCVRPDHLWLGTHTDNMRDKIAKGRYRVAKV